MTETLIIEKAIEEIRCKNFGVTEQLLNVHEVVYDDGKPKVIRVDRKTPGDTAIVYFSIKDEKFYLAIYLETIPEITVTWVETEDYHSVYFRATSDTLNLEQLAAMTKLSFTKGWSKGDQRESGKAIYTFSSLHLEPNPGPDGFEDKLRKLLDYLEQDREGVARLVDEAYGYIQVASVFHNGNTMLGGHHLDKEIIKRLGSLNLEIDFDLYAEGNFFKD